MAGDATQARGLAARPTVMGKFWHLTGARDVTITEA
jgi:hypothetical protein